MKFCNNMKKQLLIIAAAATAVLVYLFLIRSFGNPNKHLKLKAKLDTDKILNYNLQIKTAAYTAYFVLINKTIIFIRWR